MIYLAEIINRSPLTADGFTVSVVMLVGAIIALFIAMRNKLKKK